MLQFSPFNLFVIVMITILMIFFIIFVIKKLNPTSRSKKRLKVIKKYKNFDSINILEDKVGEKEDFVISKDEIYTFLAEVSRISLLGVENIVLTSRPKQLFKVFSGAYRPYQSYRSNEGATIYLYPFWIGYT